MPAPGAPTYSTDAKIAANTAFRDLLDSGAGPGWVNIRDSGDVLLAQCPMNTTCGTVDGSGVLTFDVSTMTDSSADASGTAAYAEFCDGDAGVHLSLDCSQGTTPVSGEFVMNTLTIVAAGPVEVISATIG
jgi:hypothetical protein